jgi:hypothetical protein
MKTNSAYAYKAMMAAETLKPGRYFYYKSLTLSKSILKNRQELVEKI